MPLVNQGFKDYKHLSRTVKILGLRLNRPSAIVRCLTITIEQKSVRLRVAFNFPLKKNHLSMLSGAVKLGSKLSYHSVLIFRTLHSK